MCFQDVASLPSRVSFYTTFLENCVSGKGLGTVTHLRTVVRGRQGNAPCILFFCNKFSFNI